MSTVLIMNKVFWNGGSRTKSLSEANVTSGDHINILGKFRPQISTMKTM